MSSVWSSACRSRLAVPLAQAHMCKPMLSVLVQSWENFMEFPRPRPGFPVLIGTHAAFPTCVLPTQMCCAAWGSGLYLPRNSTPLPSPHSASWDPVTSLWSEIGPPHRPILFSSNPALQSYQAPPLYDKSYVIT